MIRLRKAEARACAEWATHVDRLLDGELSPEDSRALHRHLDECAACRKEVQELRAAKQALSSLPPVAVPRGFRTRVRQAIEAELDRRRRWRPVRLVLVPALTGALLVLAWQFPASRLGLRGAGPEVRAPVVAISREAPPAAVEVGSRPMRPDTAPARQVVARPFAPRRRVAPAVPRPTPVEPGGPVASGPPDVIAAAEPGPLTSEVVVAGPAADTRTPVALVAASPPLTTEASTSIGTFNDPVEA